jgi:hypothetical protein
MKVILNLHLLLNEIKYIVLKPAKIYALVSGRRRDPAEESIKKKPSRLWDGFLEVEFNRGLLLVLQLLQVSE